MDHCHLLPLLAVTLPGLIEESSSSLSLAPCPQKVSIGYREQRALCVKPLSYTLCCLGAMYTLPAMAPLVSF